MIIELITATDPKQSLSLPPVAPILGGRILECENEIPKDLVCLCSAL